MPDGRRVFIYNSYYPPGVKKILASGTSAFVGEVDESTVLKYPLAPDNKELAARLKAEKELLQIVGLHPRIAGLKSFSEAGLYLERAVNGNVADLLLETGNPSPSILRRLSWCREAAEAVAHIHSLRILHCDIQPTNLLLDGELHVKLSDFQGRHLSEDGKVLLDGWSSEPCRFSLPRDDAFYSDVKTDLFALGCTIYFIMTNHAVFPDIVDGEDGWREKVNDRFAKKQFPQNIYPCSTVAMKCWQQEYSSAEELLQEIVRIERDFAASEKPE